MNHFIKSINTSVSAFIKEEEGSQVVEYALIIAVVSVGLVLVLANTTTGIGSSFSLLVSRITSCFTAGSTCT
ncbi:MAG: pilus assembly protein Flp/PilA [Litorivivens sp.]|jgi:pilus assembly protein Flp/PilA